MRRSMTTIIGLGIVTALFMAMMSMFYLQQVPSKEDLRQLEADLRREHGLFLASAAPMDVDLVIPPNKGERTGLEILCTMRPDIRRRPATLGLYLDRIAESVLNNPDWEGRIGYVTVTHTPSPAVTRTRRVERKTARKP